MGCCHPARQIAGRQMGRVQSKCPNRSGRSCSGSPAQTFNRPGSVPVSQGMPSGEIVDAPLVILPSQNAFGPRGRKVTRVRPAPRHKTPRGCEPVHRGAGRVATAVRGHPAVTPKWRGRYTPLHQSHIKAPKTCKQHQKIRCRSRARSNWAQEMYTNTERLTESQNPMRVLWMLGKENSWGPDVISSP